MNSRFYYCWLFSFAIFFQTFFTNAFAAQPNWQSIDTHLKPAIYCLNVGIEVRLNGGPWVQLSGLSPKQHYYVFTTKLQDQGYQIIGHGTAFPVSTTNKQKVFFVTCKHVVDEAAETIKECEMFYTAMECYVAKTALGKRPEDRLQEVLNMVNLSLNPDITTAQKHVYAVTVDAIWDCYDKNLSVKADPKQLLYSKYKKLLTLQTQTAYLLHAPGSLTQPAIEAKVYKASTTPDLAVLIAKSSDKQIVSTLDLDQTIVKRGQEVQAVGYPILTESTDPIKSYSPTFTKGKILYADANSLGFDASINKGNSGGPLISKEGKVLGVVTRKPDFRPSKGACDLYCNVALSSRAVKTLVPEFFRAP